MVLNIASCDLYLKNKDVFFDTIHKILKLTQRKTIIITKIV